MEIESPENLQFLMLNIHVAAFKNPKLVVVRIGTTKVNDYVEMLVLLETVAVASFVLV